MKKIFMFAICGIVLTTLSACSIPVYEKSVTSEYNANGELLGTTVREMIRQDSPTSSPMKVNITQKELEK